MFTSNDSNDFRGDVPVEDAEKILSGGRLNLDSLIAAGVPVDSENDNVIRWEGVIVQEGVLTGDGRMIQMNALNWSEDPIPFRWAREDQEEGHKGSIVVGSITNMTRRPNGDIWAEGYFDPMIKEATEAARQVERGQTVGVSVDLDDVTFEVQVAKEFLDQEMPEPKPTNSISEDREHVTVGTIRPDDEVLVMLSARIRAATLLAIPAFADAKIKLVSEEPVENFVAQETSVSEIVASGVSVNPPLEWFKNPNLDHPQGLVITEEGRVYGHIAAWGTCHTGQPMGPGKCVTPPSSPTNYAYFLTGSLITRENEEIAVGTITFDTLHANRTLTPTSTLSHYEHTGKVAMHVNVGEDVHGIWFAGAINPRLSYEDIRVLRASPLSGDWRRIGGSLELLAVLAVNMPGFPIPRVTGLVASGSMQSLVASGIIDPQNAPQNNNVFENIGLDESEISVLQKLARKENEKQKIINEKASALARNVAAKELARKVKG